MLDEGLGVAQGHSHRHQMQGVHQLCAGRAAALYLKGHHPAEIGHLSGSDVVPLVALQSGGVDLLHHGVAVQEFGNGLGVGAVLLHPDLQRLQTPQDQKRAEGIHHGAGHVLQAEHPHLAAEFGGAYHEACDHVPVAVEVFRGGMHHHVGAQPQRILQSGRGEGVVADHLDVLVISVRHLGHGGNVRDL